MNEQQALQILINLSNKCVANGGIFETIGEAASVNLALTVIDNLVKHEIPKTNGDDNKNN